MQVLIEQYFESCKMLNWIYNVNIINLEINTSHENLKQES